MFGVSGLGFRDVWGFWNSMLRGFMLGGYLEVWLCRRLMGSQQVFRKDSTLLSHKP